MDFNSLTQANDTIILLQPQCGHVGQLGTVWPLDDLIELSELASPHWASSKPCDDTLHSAPSSLTSAAE